MNQLVTHSEELPLSEISRKLNDDFANIFSEQAPSEAAIKSVVAITDALFCKPVMRMPTREEKLFAAKYHATQVQTLMAELQGQYEDERGNLEESHRMAADILLNISGHENDIERGVEL